MQERIERAAPPAEPWRELDTRDPAEGFLSYYLSDELSPLPVRAVTLPRNNKSDPNLETQTYGLFSTCGHSMRASVVRNGYSLIFFTTRRGTERVLTGYYRLRWYAPGKLNRTPPDYALAADDVRFVHPAVRIGQLRQPARDALANWFRVYKHVNVRTCAGLLEALRARPDRTAQYLSEIDRLERFNLHHTGYRYGAWKLKTAFDWGLASHYLHGVGRPAAGPARAAATTSQTGSWSCRACSAVTVNKALLKRCPECGAFDTLVPFAGAARGER